MGKEAKIGLAVILGLLVILGVVVSVRVASLGGDADLKATEETSEGADVESTEAVAVSMPTLPTSMKSSTKPSSSAGKANDTSIAAAPKPTVLSPDSPASSGAASPWRQSAGEGGYAGASDDPYAGSSPSYMPSPPQPVPDQPTGRYGAAYAAPAPPDASAGTDASRGAPYDPRQAGRFDTPTAASPSAPSYYGTRYPRGDDMPPGGIETRPDSGALEVSRTVGAPGTGPAANPNAGQRGDGTYEVQPNDSFWTISEKLYGTGAYFRALAEHNRSKVANQNELQVGQVVAAPDVAELEQKYPAHCPKPEHRYIPRHRTTAALVGQHGADAGYTVAEGDTLYRIARHELGDASRWHEIYKLNREVLGESFHHLRPGTQLILPGNSGAEPADTLTRRPGSMY